jgi:hypothetical protein
MHDGGCRTGALADRLRAQPAGRATELGTWLPQPGRQPGCLRNRRPGVVLFFGGTIQSVSVTVLRGATGHFRQRPNV